ncbi:MAG: DUF2997 domain-containing protein [Phycisphaerae bacterium]
MKIIEIIVNAKGEARLETKGFAGASCRDASRFIENALGKKLSDRPTAELHQVQAEQTQDIEHT